MIPYYFWNARIRKTRILLYDHGLVVLPVQDECFTQISYFGNYQWLRNLPFLGLGIFGSGWQRQISLRHATAPDFGLREGEDRPSRLLLSMRVMVVGAADRARTCGEQSSFSGRSSSFCGSDICMGTIGKLSFEDRLLILTALGFDVCASIIWPSNGFWSWSTERPCSKSGVGRGSTRWYDIGLFIDNVGQGQTR